MKHIGHPLAGDAMYGIDSETGGGTGADAHADTDADAKKAEGISLDRHALHAARLAFAHPADRRPIGFEAPLPDDMAGLIGRLRREHHLV
jgi:23S rRNA pseudouridine1911/1915/1917 synthase